MSEAISSFMLVIYFFFLKHSVATIKNPAATDHLQSSLLSVWKMRTTCNTEMSQENYTNILSVACCVTKDKLGCLFHCTWRNYENTQSRRVFSQSHFRQWSCSSVEVRCSSWGPQENKAKCDIQHCRPRRSTFAFTGFQTFHKMKIAFLMDF